MLHKARLRNWFNVHDHSEMWTNDESENHTLAMAMFYNTMTVLTCGAPHELPVEYMQCEVMTNTFSFGCAAEDGYMQDIVQQLMKNEAKTERLQTVYRAQNYWMNHQRTDHVNSFHVNVGACTAFNRRSHRRLNDLRIYN